MCDYAIQVAISDSYRGPLWRALGVQALIALLSVLVLDGGDTAKLSGVALIAFWVSVFVIILRRPRNPTQVDLWLIRWGFLPLVIFVQVAARLVWWELYQ